MDRLERGGRRHEDDFEHRAGVLQVDGGINRKTIAAAAAAGADCFVAGSAIFGKEDYAAEVAALRALAEQAG